MDRKDFLGKMYESYWSNINRAEDSLWKIFAAYTALFAGLGIAVELIGTFGFLFIMTIFSFAGIISSLVSNSWFVRNMGLIANIEKEFLEKTDLDVLIPKSWTNKKVSFVKLENWWIIIALFFAVIIAIHIILFSTLVEQEIVIQLALDILGFIAVVICWCILNKKHNNFVANAEGKTIS